MQIEDIEKLGAFYFGRVVDDKGNAGRPLLLDSRALTTHAVCIGMTGSGKTGLCTALLEEAAIDGVGAIIIDPKGDLGGLCCSFDVDDAARYAAFVDPFEARRLGLSVDERAQQIAAQWKQGLEGSLQTPARVNTYRTSAEVVLYTPGASHGRALSLVKSFAAPSAALLNDLDGWRQRLQAQASSLLALLGESADPIQSREHVLLSAILDDAARTGTDLSLADIVRRVQKPPFATVGVLDVETFYSSADRTKLALRLNNLLASPGFAAWMQGDPLDVGALLNAPDGKPRLSILNLAHLSDAERMFVVTLIAGELVAWMRQQPGTQSLRGLLFVDEVTGFIPPVANPPSKQPLMTLFKQARAFGLGVVLASQNPVDIDYKALANAGTWMLGRLQTARDRERVVDGLAGVVDGALLDEKLSALPKRSFFIHSVHLPEPVVVQSRCTLTYLPGPLTPPQIKALTSTAPPAATTTTTTPPSSSVKSGQAMQKKTEQACVYKPALLVTAELSYRERVSTISETTRVLLLSKPVVVDVRAPLVALPAGAQTHGELPLLSDEKKAQEEALRRIVDEVPLVLKRENKLDVTQLPGESERSFMDRVVVKAREQHDKEKDAIEQKFKGKLERLDEKRKRLLETKARHTSRASEEKMEAVASLGEGLLGALFGRKTFSATNVRKATSAVKAKKRAEEEQQKAQELDAELLQLHDEIQDLERDLSHELSMSTAKNGIALEERTLRADRHGSRVVDVAWVWAPLTSDGSLA